MHTLVLNADGAPLSYVPLSVVTWHEAINDVFKEKAVVLKDHPDWVVRSQKLEFPVPSIIMMKEHKSWDKKVKYSRGNVYLRDNFTCQLQITKYCRSVKGKVGLNDLTLDHVVPKSQGGRTTWKNITTCCKECNSTKGDNERIVPFKAPHTPTYYEILSKRKEFPLYIRDEDWKMYLDWPDELIRLLPLEKQL